MLDGFHAAVRAWFTETLGEPTQPQREGWPAIRAGKHVLIAAPTGTGKTLAAFLNAIDHLIRQGPHLSDQTQILYLSPLKALSNDVRKNLELPLEGIRRQDALLPSIRVSVRTGDTTAAERAKMLRQPPHILVTTPESLYILLTAERGRELLRTVKTVIVDEIHAVAGDKRGAHLMLSLERLEALAGPVQRIGLSATQKPLSEIANFLVGFGRSCQIVDAGHLRNMNLAVEIPRSPLETVCSHEVWGELYERMSELILEHRTTLIFVNTRKLAERLSARLSERLGKENVSCHHGSLSKTRRLQAEQRLKAGQLRALVATASLELGIDIGDVDLVLQIASPRSIATFLQRAGRAGHGITRTPKARLFPLTIDELAEAAALLNAIRNGVLDVVPQPCQPLDILAQQVVAACVPEVWNEDELYESVTRAWPYRQLTRETFDQVVELHTQGRYALLHRDGVQRRLRATRRARLTALTSGGAIPDTGVFEVREEPEGTFIGTLDEDFSIESAPGDIFQLGNTSWRILRIEARAGIVRVANAEGAPPNLPFWFGEAPGRTRELGEEVGNLRANCTGIDWLIEHCRLSSAAAEQLWNYLEASHRALGKLPTHKCIVAERFFDDSGGMQLILHSPFGARINRAWGLALRKKFCRGFGFELEAAANEDALLLSLAPTNSFPLPEIFDFLSPQKARETLIQACITGGQFETRWRWNVTRALLVERFSKGKKVPAFLLRIRSNDALAQAFPSVLACPENMEPGPLEIPLDHPLVVQTIEDCLQELMDLDGLIRILEGLQAGTIERHSADTPEPSPMAAHILAAQPYAFLDDVPAEERRTRAVAARPGWQDTREAGELTDAAVERVREEIWPQPRDAEEVHESLLWMGYVTDIEAKAWLHWLQTLQKEGRVEHDGQRWYAVETDLDPKKLLKGRLEALGPLESDAPEMLALENEGVVLRTRYRGRTVWCHRRILARIHRYMLERLRQEIEPVSAATVLRFLNCWQGAAPEYRQQGPRGVAAVLTQLAGFECPAAAWESAILPLRVEGFRRDWLDHLTLTGEFAWGRLWSDSVRSNLDGPKRTGPIRSTPIGFVRREDLTDWLTLAPVHTYEEQYRSLSGNAQTVFDVLKSRGAVFTLELGRATNLLPEHLELALGELIARGWVTCDSFAALRWLLIGPEKRKRLSEPGGRWSLFRAAQTLRYDQVDEVQQEGLTLFVARQLLKRTGIVFRKTLERERQPLPWRDLLRAYRTMELRGEVRGGRFIAGFSGEQYALPEAVELLRKVNRMEPRQAEARLSVAVLPADPLNFQGILTPDEKINPLLKQRIRVG